MEPKVGYQLSGNTITLGYSILLSSKELRRLGQLAAVNGWTVRQYINWRLSVGAPVDDEASLLHRELRFGRVQFARLLLGEQWGRARWCEARTEKGLLRATWEGFAPEVCGGTERDRREAMAAVLCALREDGASVRLLLRRIEKRWGAREHQPEVKWI